LAGCIIGTGSERPEAETRTDLKIGTGRKTLPISYPPYENQAVEASAWQALDNSVGYIFCNISHDPVSFEVPLTTNIWNNANRIFSVEQYSNGVVRPFVSGKVITNNLVLHMNPLDVAIVAIIPAAPDIISISRATDSIQILWKQVGSEYIVEYCTDLHAPLWLPVDGVDWPTRTNICNVRYNVFDQAKYYRIQAKDTQIGTLR
jgi:hypothetical protein